MWADPLQRGELTRKISEALSQTCEHGVKPKSDCAECQKIWQHNSYENNKPKNLLRASTWYKAHKKHALANGIKRWRESKYWLKPFKIRYQRRYFIIYNLYRNRDGRVKEFQRNEAFEEQLLAQLEKTICKCRHHSRFHTNSVGNCNVCICKRLYSPELAKMRKFFREQLVMEAKVLA